MDTTNAIAPAAEAAPTEPTTAQLIEETLSLATVAELPIIRRAFTRLVWSELKGDKDKTRDDILKSSDPKSEQVIDLVVHGHWTAEPPEGFPLGSYNQMTRNARLMLGLPDGTITYGDDKVPTVKDAVRKARSSGTLGTLSVKGNVLTITHGELIVTYTHGKDLTEANVIEAWAQSDATLRAWLEDEDTTVPSRRAAIAVSNARKELAKARKKATEATAGEPTGDGSSEPTE